MRCSGNEGFRQRGLDSQCRVVLGDAHNMPLEDGSYDAAYAVYALKYIPRLDGVMEEVCFSKSVGTSKA